MTNPDKKRRQGEKFADYVERIRAMQTHERHQYVAATRKPRNVRRHESRTYPDPDGRDFDNLGESPDY